MDELLPAATLIAMDDPLRWLQTVESQLVVQPPCAPARWLTPKGCLAALQWYAPLGRELVTVFLMAHADRIEIGVWTTAWSDDQVSSWMYHELVITIATLIIAQYADQDGPLPQLHIQPYTDMQAPLQELSAGRHSVQEDGWTPYHRHHNVMVPLTDMRPGPAPRPRGHPRSTGGQSNPGG